MGVARSSCYIATLAQMYAVAWKGGGDGGRHVKVWCNPAFKTLPSDLLPDSSITVAGYRLPSI